MNTGIWKTIERLLGIQEIFAGLLFLILLLQVFVFFIASCLVPAGPYYGLWGPDWGKTSNEAINRYAWIAGYTFALILINALLAGLLTYLLERRREQLQQWGLKTLGMETMLLMVFGFRRDMRSFYNWLWREYLRVRKAQGDKGK